MKKAISIIFLVILSITLPIFGQKQAAKNSKLKVKVYYFHPDERCPIDQSVEKNTIDLMQSVYKDKIKEGVIEFRVVNTDDKSNDPLVTDFEINAQALYIVSVGKGKETKTDLTKFAFDWGLSNPMKFKKGLKEEIEKNLKK